MMDLDQAAPILWVLFLAVLAPVIADLFGKARVPVLVIEMILGILAGPDVLHLVSVTPTLETLSHYGLAFLFFLVGLELLGKTSHSGHEGLGHFPHDGPPDRLHP